MSKTVKKNLNVRIITQPAITCSKLTTETLEQDVKYVQKLTIKTYFTPCSNVFIVNFEQANAGWVSQKQVLMSSSHFRVQSKTRENCKFYFKNKLASLIVINLQKSLSILSKDKSTYQELGTIVII